MGAAKVPEQAGVLCPACPDLPAQLAPPRFTAGVVEPPRPCRADGAPHNWELQPAPHTSVKLPPWGRAAAMSSLSRQVRVLRSPNRSSHLPATCTMGPRKLQGRRASVGGPADGLLAASLDAHLPLQRSASACAKERTCRAARHLQGSAPARLPSTAARRVPVEPRARGTGSQQSVSAVKIRGWPGGLLLRRCLCASQPAGPASQRRAARCPAGGAPQHAQQHASPRRPLPSSPSPPAPHPPWI